MINQAESLVQSHRLGPAALLLIGLVAASTFAGCKKKAEQSSLHTPRQTTTQSSVAVRPTRLRPEDLALAPGVQFPAERVPDDEASARAVASLASAIASGDAATLRGMLDSPDAAVLDQLVASGQWAQSAEAISVVRVSVLEGTDAKIQVGLGIQDDRGAYLLGWEGAPARGGWQFHALPVKSPQAARASDLDGASLTELDIPTPEPVVAESAPSRPPTDKNKKNRSRGGQRRRRSTIGPG